MSDFNHNNNDLNNDRPQESQTSRRTYDLDNHPQEPQASFGSGDWQWQPAQPQPEPKKRPRWGRIVLSVVAVAVAAALCFTAGGDSFTLTRGGQLYTDSSVYTFSDGEEVWSRLDALLSFS